MLQAQDVSWYYDDGTPIIITQEKPEEPEKAGLPRQFRELQLGMGLEQLKNALIKSCLSQT